MGADGDWPALSGRAPSPRPVPVRAGAQGRPAAADTRAARASRQPAVRGPKSRSGIGRALPVVRARQPGTGAASTGAQERARGPQGRWQRAGSSGDGPLRLPLLTPVPLAALGPYVTHRVSVKTMHCGLSLKKPVCPKVCGLPGGLKSGQKKPQTSLSVSFTLPVSFREVNSSLLTKSLSLR